MATMKEIAAMAGVSRGTVDRVLNKRGSVNPKTEKAILEIAETLNYTPNVAGKNLAVRKKKLKIGFILFGTVDSNSFFVDVIDGINSRAAELSDLGVTVEIRQDSYYDPEQQVKNIEELVELGINGLAIAPLNAGIVAEKLKELTQSGIPVVTANSDIPDCGRMAYVGSNYYRSGETAAGLMNLITNGNASIGIVSGAKNVLCHSERIAGFTDYSKKNFPNLKIVDTVMNNDSDEESFSVTKKMLLDNPGINAMYLTAAGVCGACRAVKEMGLADKLSIVSFDATATTSELIKDGIISVTIAQQPKKQGEIPLDILFNYLCMGTLPEKEQNYTDIEIIIKESLL